MVEGLNLPAETGPLNIMCVMARMLPHTYTTCTRKLDEQIHNVIRLIF